MEETTNKPKICPHCKMEIDCLNFDVTATCSAQMYQSDLDKFNPCEYDADCLFSNAQFDNFCCEYCGGLIAETEEKAREFLK